MSDEARAGHEARCIGLRLATARRERRISAEDAARTAGMGRSTLYATEQGRRVITLVEAAALARLYRLSLDQLVRECCGPNAGRLELVT